MTSTITADDRADDRANGRADDPVSAAACRLYDAECALHAAHQAHQDAWVAAASEKLHAAVEGYLAATAR